MRGVMSGIVNLRLSDNALDQSDGAIDLQFNSQSIAVSIASNCYARTEMALNIIFDGPPSPPFGRFVEVENDAGQSLNAGEWIDKGNGLWALRITRIPDEPTVEGMCSVCGLAMKPEESMFMYHGYSESCEQAKARLASA